MAPPRRRPKKPVESDSESESTVHEEEPVANNSKMMTANLGTHRCSSKTSEQESDEISSESESLAAIMSMNRKLLASQDRCLTRKPSEFDPSANARSQLAISRSEHTGNTTSISTSTSAFGLNTYHSSLRLNNDELLNNPVQNNNQQKSFLWKMMMFVLIIGFIWGIINLF